MFLKTVSDFCSFFVALKFEIRLFLLLKGKVCLSFSGAKVEEIDSSN